jgi:hypothetical protein
MRHFFVGVSLSALALFPSFATTIAAVPARPTLSFYGIARGEPKDPRCRAFQGECLILKDLATPVVLRSYGFAVPDAATPKIQLSPHQADGTRLAKLMAANLNGRVAVVIGDQVVAAMAVRAVPATLAVELSFHSDADFQSMIGALTGADVAGTASNTPKCKP